MKAHQLAAGMRLPAGMGHSTALPDLDFETFSEAGYIFDPMAGRCGRWQSISGPKKKGGIFEVGAPAYAEHSSTRVLSLAYNLKDGIGPRLWVPGAPPPVDLFNHIAQGNLLEAHNSGFEWLIWRFVCFERMGWPFLDHRLLRCSQSKARAFALPAALGPLSRELEVEDEKIADGQRLIKKFSCPRSPTLKDPRLRIDPSEDPVDGLKLYDYNLGDIASESAVSALMPDLIPQELELWLLDQTINFRGVAIDTVTLEEAARIIDQAVTRYTAELIQTTGGQVQTVSELQKLQNWLESQGVVTGSLEADRVEKLLRLLTARDLSDLHPVDAQEAARLQALPNRDGAIRALQLRQLLGSASVKKVAAIQRRLNTDGRLRELFAYCGADRTGRWAGRGPQPQNLPSSGPDLAQCDPIGGCGHYYNPALDVCPWCNAPGWASEVREWSFDMVDDALVLVQSGSLDLVERYMGDAMAVICGILRSLFVSAEGHDLICSDYSAIEAVVLAALAGEEWRLEVFRTHGKIYETSAAKISGVPFQEFLDHKERTGDHHPLRKKIGKVAELASGYGGGVGAWLAFGADKHLTEQEIKDAIKRWREESPAIRNFWYALERAAIAAVQTPGVEFPVRALSFICRDDCLYIRLPSGRYLSYHKPRLTPDVTPWGADTFKLSYMGNNNDYKKGPKGWLRLETYGGKLTENVTQAVARDILAHALPKLEARGYKPVLHVHDEVVVEVPEGFGSVEEVEAIMADLPAWAAGWPIKAAGGWRGKRYRKD